MAVSGAASAPKSPGGRRRDDAMVDAPADGVAAALRWHGRVCGAHAGRILVCAVAESSLNRTPEQRRDWDCDWGWRAGEVAANDLGIRSTDPTAATASTTAVTALQDGVAISSDRWRLGGSECECGGTKGCPGARPGGLSRRGQRVVWRLSYLCIRCELRCKLLSPSWRQLPPCCDVRPRTRPKRYLL